MNVTGVVPHPSKFSPNVLTVMRHALNQYEPLRHCNVLDPFGGVGGIHELGNEFGCRTTWCVELEIEWAAQAAEHGWSWCGDFFKFAPTGGTLMGPWFHKAPGWMKPSPDLFDVIATSPTYGNRMADHHNARDSSTRITYKHKLGRDPSPGSSAVMHYGPEYKAFHIRAYSRFRELLVPDGLIMLNVSDFIRAGKVVEASKWHHDRMVQLGFEHLKTYQIPTQRMGMGANRDARVDGEQLHVYRAPQ